MLAFEVLIVYDLNAFQQSQSTDIRSLALVIGTNSKSALRSKDARTANTALDALRARSEITTAALYDDAGRILGRYRRNDIQTAKIPAAPRENGANLEKGNLEVFQSVTEDGKVLGSVYICSDSSTWAARIRGYGWIVLCVLLGSMLLAFLVAWFLQRTISAPIVSLAHTMRRVSAQKNYSLRAEKPSNDEIGSLVDGFNAMLSEIQERDVVLREMNDALEARVRERTQELESEIKERKRAEEEITARSNELLTLHRISQADLGQQSLGAALDNIVEEIRNAIGFPVVVVETYDKRRQMMVFQAATGLDSIGGKQYSEIPADESLSGVVARSGSPLVQVAGQANDESSQAFLEAAGVRTFLCMPMVSAEGVFGTLSLAHFDAIEPDKRLLRWLESLANYLGFMLEKHHSQDMLRQSEETTRNVIETALDAVVSADSHGMISGWNGQAEAIFGWTREEVLGKPLEETIVSAKTRNSAPIGLTQLSQPGERTNLSKRIELTARHKSGREFPAELSITPVKTAAGVTFTAFIRDITERKEAEQQLAKARDAAIDAARLKSEFLANMSHEIRTPMNGVIGMTDLLLDTSLDEEQKDYANTIRNSAEALLTVINDILDFSKIEAGKMLIENTETNLRQLLEEVTDLLAAVAQRKGVEMLCAIRPNVPEFVRADSVRIRQVINNLVGNAVKFTSEGEVVLMCELLGETATHVQIRLSVRDTGIGIPQDGVKRIFESFTQVDGSTTRRFGGTGLGLTICRQLVNLMGGTIGVSSKVGIGSTFWIELNLEKAEHQTSQKHLPGDIHGLRVLVVDDNSTNRFILREQLRCWGCRSDEVENGSEALVVMHDAKDDPYALVIMDMQMPELDGMQTAALIRKDPRLANAKLILLSSIGEQWPRKELAEAGFAACLSKPVRQSQLFNIIIELMGYSSTSEPINSEGHENVLEPVLKILVAEDNIVNRKVATKLLHRLGHEVTCAENGVEAVKLATGSEFDLVLMDVQMPEMDGLEATAAIRQFQADSEKRIAIIAMTAHVMKGDRERCLAAGMDDYVSKPITPEKIKRVLRKWGKKDTQQNAVSSLSKMDGAFDEQYLAEVISNEALFGAELLKEFCNAGPNLLDEIRKSVQAGDLEAAGTYAHSLKGCSASLGANGLSGACKAMEVAVSDRDIGRCSELLMELEFRIIEVIAYLQKKFNKAA